MRRTLSSRKILASAALLAASVGPLAIASPAQAANQCEHFTHRHYHFPYAHYDEHRYDGSHFHYDNYHYHHYKNTTHNTPYEKRC